MKAITTTFDYSALEAEVASAARTAADRIRRRLRTAYVETGRDLIQIKERLGHGNFGVWLKAEFGMTERSAENYMNASRWLEGKSETVADLPAAAVYALAAPSAPASVVNEVVAAVEAGAKLPTRAIKCKLAEALAAERKAAEEAAKTDEQRKKEKRSREARAARAAAAERKFQDEQEHARRLKQEVTDHLVPLVKRVSDAITLDDLREIVDILDSHSNYRRQQALIQLLREQVEVAR